MRRVAVLVVAVLLPLLLVQQPAGSTARASAYVAPEGVTFNVPRPWGSPAETARIVQKVEEAFRNVRRTARDPRPTILVAAYLFDRNKSADALIAACRRGVSVRVIIDADVVSRPFRRLVTALNADNVPDRDRDGIADRGPRTGRCNTALAGGGGGMRTQPRPLMTRREVLRSIREPLGTDVRWGADRSYVLQCSGSCRGGDNANMHSKIYAFSSVGRSDNVVMTASTNLNAGGVLSGWNELFVMRERPKTFAFIERIHRLMTEQRHAGSQLVELVDGPYTTRIFPMSRVGETRDPLMQDLRKVRCSSDLGPTTLHIQQFWWNGHRGEYIWRKIRDLATQGCVVKIIFGAVDRNLLARMKDARRAGLIELYDSRIDTDGDGCVNTRTHMKTLAIRGTYAGNRRYAGVWTGTANWATGSLNRGDEITVNIRGAKVWKRYVDYWKVVRNHSTIDGNLGGCVEDGE
jgi:hypothetical protein